jgi:hypothetical protein
MIRLEKPQILFQGQKKYANRVDLGAKEAVKAKVVIVYSFHADRLPDAVTSMLNKLIAACKVNMEDVVFINNFSQQLTLSDIHLRYSPSYILLFGETGAEKNLTALKLNMEYELYGLNILKTISPEKLISSDKDKAALWKALQGLFKLNATAAR